MSADEFDEITSTDKGESALHRIVRGQCPPDDTVKIIDRLLKNKSNINIVNKNGQTPLHLAAYNKSPETLKILLDYGADVNYVDKDGRTPLYLAAYIEDQSVYKGCIKSIRLLLKNGADISIKDAKDVGFSSTIIKYGFIKLVGEYLENYEVENRYYSHSSPNPDADTDQDFDLLFFLLKNARGINVGHDRIKVSAYALIDKHPLIAQFYFKEIVKNFVTELLLTTDSNECTELKINQYCLASEHPKPLILSSSATMPDSTLSQPSTWGL
jgi:Ankyrin repeats (3 copies)